MASDINKDSRKRKSTSDLIFEVDEADISPSVTPDPTEKIVCNSVEKTEVYQALNDVKEIQDDNIMKTEDIVLENEIKRSSGELTVNLIVSDQPNTVTETKTLQINDSLKSNENSISTNGTEEYFNEVNIDTMAKGDSVLEIPKSDVDLRCMDMEVANSPPPVNTDKPFISIIFRDKDTAIHARSKLTHFIQNLIDFELKIKVNPCLSDMSIDFWEANTENKIQNDMSGTYESILTKPENLDMFVVDTTPSKQRELLPRYTPVSHCKTIGELEQVESPAKCRPTQTCFNCDGDHSMRDCREVRNARRIAMARNKFKSHQQKQNIRYHVDDELKYKHLQPGKITDELRRALDVRKHELPPYIYRMRTLGYPPGWLQEAMISNSDLELFDFQGCAVGDGGGDCNRKIDSSKVVEYPGFNAPLEKGFKDEFKYFNCPPYNEKHSKECMVQYIERVTEQVTVTKETRTITNQTAPKEPESDSNSQESECTEKQRRSESPSLTDLELRKRQLLAELEDGSLNSPQPTNDKQVNPLSADIIESPNVVASSFGTPLLKTASPYFQLPDRDKFSRDISQVINFENLPDSTGKYEQMTAVIDKVRKIVKNNKS